MSVNWDDLRVFLEVARTEKLSHAAKLLGIDPSTVSRRLHRLEDSLGTQLFDRSVDGHALTEHGLRLLDNVQLMDQRAQQATDQLQGKNREPEGRVRLGVTEAFGNYFVAPELARFCQQHPLISIDLLPLQRFVKWSRHEVDIAITIEKPDNASLIITKLCDYRLQLYGADHYLSNHAPINELSDLQQHPMIGYIDDLIFSDQLSYLERLLPGSTPAFRSTSVITQQVAAAQGLGLAILPCFMARQDSRLKPVLSNQTSILRTFWMAVQPEQKKLARVNHVWEHLKQHAADQRPMLMGQISS